MKRKFMALALAAAMTVSMTSAVFAADEIKSADDLEGKKIGVQLGTTGDADATEVIFLVITSGIYVSILFQMQRSLKNLLFKLKMNGIRQFL